MQTKICQKEGHTVICEMDDLSFEVEGCITVKYRIKKD